jgi:hypothetical protein
MKSRTLARIFAALLLALLAASANAAHLHRTHFLSATGRAIAAEAMTPDCYYWDVNTVRRLKPVSGVAGQTSCVARDGMKVATFTSHEVRTEVLLRRIYGEGALPVVGRVAGKRTSTVSTTAPRSSRHLQAPPLLCLDHYATLPLC